MEKSNEENVKLNPWNVNNKLITKEFIINFFKTYDIDIEINDYLYIKEHLFTNPILKKNRISVMVKK